MNRTTIVLVGALGALAGCARTSTGVAAPPAVSATLPAGASTANPSAPVARIDGAPITEGELLAEARAALAAVEAKAAAEAHGVKTRALDALIEARLLSDRAAREGIPVEALVEREIGSRIPEPTEEYLQSVYDTTKANRPVPPFPEVREEIRAFVKAEQAREGRRAFVARLRAEARVEVLLPPLLLPRVSLSPDGPSKGAPDAPVTVVEFSDYECQFCGAADGLLRRLLSDRAGKVRVVFQSYPLSIHANARKASEAALCAGEQGRYWEMHDRLFADRNALSVDHLKAHARALGLDAAAFDACLGSGRMAPAVEASKRAGDAAGVTATPTIFVNGRPLADTQSYERLLELVDHELGAR